MWATLWALLHHVLYLHHSFRCFHLGKLRGLCSWGVLMVPSNVLHDQTNLSFFLCPLSFLVCGPYFCTTVPCHREGGLIVILKAKGKHRTWKGLTTQVVFHSTMQDVIRLDHDVHGVSWCGTRSVWAIVWGSLIGERRVLHQDKKKKTQELGASFIETSGDSEHRKHMGNCSPGLPCQLRCQEGSFSFWTAH